MLIGNVGVEPEVRYYEADQAVATLRMATTEKGYTLQNGTRVPDRTEWHNIVFYRRLAKVVEQYVHKGDKLYVEGKLQYRQYDDKRGIQRTVTEIIVDNMELLTPRSQSVVNQQQKLDNSHIENKGNDNVDNNSTEEIIAPFRSVVWSM